MLYFLPSPILGTLSFILISLNTIFWFFMMVPTILLKIILFPPQAQTWCSNILARLASKWVIWNSGILKLTQKTEWDIQGVEGLSTENSYLVISNHQSWADIFVLQHVLKGEAPFLRFFIKSVLIWVPFLGVTWWALDMPFMKRYSKEYLKKNPHKKGQDLESTKRSCEKFKSSRVSVINFVEGSRSTSEKREKQQSPFKHLLKPKAGGVGLTLSVMGDYFKEVLDVTIVYPQHIKENQLWKLLCGKLPKIEVQVQRRPVPVNVMGRNYQEDPEYKHLIQNWINQIWDEKDLGIEEKYKVSKEFKG